MFMRCLRVNLLAITTLSMVNTNAESFILHISETKRANQFKVFEKVRPQNFLASD